MMAGRSSHDTGEELERLREEVRLLREALRLASSTLPTGPDVAGCMSDIVHALPVLAFCCDTDGRVVTANSRFAAMCQCSPVSRTLRDVLPTATVDELLCLVERAWQAQDVRSGVVPMPPGLFQCVVQPRLDAAGRLSRVLCVGHDVSGLLRGNHELVHALVGASPVTTLLLDRECTVLLGNASAAALMLWPPEGQGDGDCFRFLPEDIATRRREEVLRCFETGCAVEFEDTQDGRTYHHFVRPIPARDHGATVVGEVAVYSLDVTLPRRAEADLRAAARLHAALAEASSRQFDRQSALLDRVFDEVPAGICLMDITGRVLHLNRAMADVVGASETELVGTDCFAMLHPADRAAARALFMHDLENAGSPEGFHELKEYRFLRKDGTARECQVASAMLRDGDGPILGMAVVTDVTEMRRIKAEAARMGQLATIGELAAGVAHEINSPANAIINCADLLMEDAFDSAMVRDMARRIRSEGQRVAAITHNLLAFARERKPPPPPALVDVKVVLRDTLELTAAQMRAEGILLEVSCSSGALHVLGRTRELQQVFLNIVSNARHALNAIPGSAARCLSINAEPRAAGSCVSGPVVSVSFRDTGGGIDPSIRDRVMEPFFTTKGEGRGTGLGLSISNAIIEDHGGVLRIESDGETGTCVTVELPQMVEDGDA
ncbi:PAS domain-containing protein [Nitratidesulfovibrio vulgaris]|uniref:PAS domain-containing protein n=1 Tax=Nitratidesulfovibrio vulgaris TaxID=881 RepID=UPI0013DEE37C|nr:PAS domain-containing protein [Nitratidesulfovibrio vulgaris]